MNGGTVSTVNNSAVYINDSADCTMQNGTISNRSSSGTVYLIRTNIADTPTFTINGGEVKNSGAGAGIYSYTTYSTGIFTTRWHYPTVNLNGGSWKSFVEAHS